EKYFGKNSPFAHWAHELSELCGLKQNGENPADPSEALATLKLYQEAFGPAVERVMTPLFDPKKAVRLTSSWNWGRRDLIRSFWEEQEGKNSLTAEAVHSLLNRATSEMALTAHYFSKSAGNRGNKKLAQKMRELAKRFEKESDRKPVFHLPLKSFSPEVGIDPTGKITYHEIPRTETDWVKALVENHFVSGEPSVLKILKKWKSGLNFSGQTALVTGASPGSIAWEMVRAFLAGGGQVVATTSSYHEERLKAFRNLYQKNAGRGALLHVVPFSQGSEKDIHHLIQWCFSQKLIPDFLIPFAAAGETATLTMMNGDSSTATLRVLLQGVQWLIAAMARALKEVPSSKKCLTILPLSPNHGTMGGDGAYADSKLALESLLNRWHSEKADWGRQISLMGVTIGWVRGTGLMAANNMIAATMEKEAKVRTFSTEEMGGLLTLLCHSDLRQAAGKAPLSIQITGRFEKVKNISDLALRSRTRLEKEAKLKRKNIQETKEETIEPKAPFLSDFPELSFSPSPQPSPQREREKVVVVVGYGEVSPFGSSRPRWEMETGQTTLAGLLELAWIMGLIRYEDGMSSGQRVGWVDVQTAEPVSDNSLWDRYGKRIQEETGVRFTDPEVQTFDAERVLVFGNITLERELSFPVPDKKQGEEYLRESPDTARLFQDDGQWRVLLPKGSLIKVPRRVRLTRRVAGQLPKGWDPLRFGLSKEMATQSDRNTLFHFVASAEAFCRAGLEPEELYETLSPCLV
ncbi:MAG: SDR family NAD(P)-dependent oxidoreductase, partial [bacterium]|nr:SDR family NAD(P)-dependent oxidoreductase [bacterium]